MFGFETQRLNVIDAKDIVHDDKSAASLYVRLPELLTDEVLKTLPPYFENELAEYSAKDWVKRRLDEGEMLAIVERQSNAIIGLMFVFVETDSSDQLHLRIGYLFHQQVWGQGFASELLLGFVEHCAKRSTVASIAGGVEVGNVASARVLEKAGFELDQSQSTPETLQYVKAFVR